MFVLFISCYSRAFFIIPVARENTRIKLALAIPAGTPITLVKEMIGTPPLVANKTIKTLSK